jgi:transcriptional regulator with XRE-family HTH domain
MMSEAEGGEEATLFPKTAGERLREAREAQGLALAEIASRTRVPIRQLEAIELGDYASLPSITYAIGFAKAYARAVGVDEVAIAKEVRGQFEFAPQRAEYQPYDTADPARVPSRGLMFGTAAIALLLVIAAGLFYGTTLFRGGAPEQAAPPPLTLAPAAPVETAPAPVQSGQVTLTALDQVWVRIYDATGKTLYQATMNAGDHYDVPSDANGPMINVGRPDKLQVTVNGSNVPPLGDGRVAIEDVALSAQALLARATPAAAPTPAVTPAVTRAKKPAGKVKLPPYFQPVTPSSNVGSATPAKTGNGTTTTPGASTVSPPPPSNATATP